jgi:hypothetical protein
MVKASDPPPPKSPSAEREARLAQALRRNLKLRKAARTGANVTKKS